jgi:Protein of unknown function (DUF3015)
MRKYSLLIVLIASLAFATSALAAGYGAAGCGFGGAIIKDNKILPQIGAWFLNGLLGNQTFAMTSGTSNCGGMGKMSENKQQEQFVENNYPSLAKEMAAGEGENLNALAGLMGCSSEQTGHFAVFAKQNYGSIFPDEQTTPTEMLDTLKKEISSDPELAAACPRI